MIEHRRWQLVRVAMKLPQTSSSGNQLLRAWELYFGETPNEWKPRRYRSGAAVVPASSVSFVAAKNSKKESGTTVFKASAAAAVAKAEPEMQTTAVALGQDQKSSAAANASESTPTLRKMKGIVVDPAQLKQIVFDMGGFQHCCDQRLWQRVRQQLGIPHSSSSGNNLIRIYKFYFNHPGRGHATHSGSSGSSSSRNANKNGVKGNSTSLFYKAGTKNLETKRQLDELSKKYKAGRRSDVDYHATVAKDPWYFWGKTDLESFQQIQEEDVNVLKVSIGYKDHYEQPSLGKYCTS